ncbi:MAG: insulinase family protein [Deltaproteobacteria bacterium]|nr:insulinase family protein [Deltaproteobacteria bacterium]
MTHTRRALLALAVFCLLAMTGIEALADPGKVYRTKLDNGLTVVIEEDDSAPVVSVQMWVKVGSADEPQKLAGISHVFEHMLFKGTAKKGVGQIATMIESVGGDINAYTSFDNTVYHLTVPSRHFSTGLDVISDAIQHSSFDPAELKKELEVVLEEIRMNEDTPGRRLFKSLLGTAYSTHPYGRPVIGFADTVKSFTRQDILNFFRKWYVPNNMVLVIVGDVEHEAALKAVKEAFNGFKARPEPHRKRPVEPAQKSLRTGVLAMEVQDTQLGMTFHITSVKETDTYAIDVLENILSGGETSRLYKKLKLEDELVHGISVYSMALKDPGLLFVTAMLKPENAGKTITGALEVINELGDKGPDLEELERAKFNIESSFVYSRETMDGLASKLGFFEVNLQDYAFEKKYIENIRKVTPEDIKRVTAKYLTPSNMSVSVLVPKAQESSITPELLAESAKAASLKTAAKTAPEESDESKTTKTVLENGITLIVKEVRSNPTVAFYAAFPGGLRFEETAKNGIGSFTAAMLTNGTTKMTREELSKELEDIAGGVSGFSGWNSTGASGKFLSRFFDKGLTTLADVIMNPVFPEKEIEKLRVDTLAAIARQEDNLPGYTFKLLYRELFDVHPYGMQTIGTKESISALKRDDLIAHHSAFFTPDRMVLTIVGDIDAERAKKKVSELFANFRRTSAALPVPPKDKPEIAIEKTGASKDKEQTHVAIGFNGTTIGSDDSYALRVMTEILSGQGGRLFLELRDKKSLAYSVSAFSKEAVDPGMIAAYIATAPGKKEEAIQGLLGEFRKMREEPVSIDELNRAKRSIIGSYEIGLQSVSSQSVDMANSELYGLGYAFSKVYPEKIEAVTAEDVTRVAKKYLDLDAYVISIVGPADMEEKAQ